jgi:cytoskeletal protein CcmA (bactofilin family)
MLGSKRSTYSVSGTTTLVSRETVVVGDIQFSGNLEVEGVVRGNIVAQPGKEAMVRVVERGRVEGEVRVPLVIINGTVEGNVHASKHLELAAKGRVNGNVFYTLLKMAMGSEVNGNLTHVESQEPSKEKAGKPNRALELKETVVGSGAVSRASGGVPAAVEPAKESARTPAKVD